MNAGYTTSFPDPDHVSDHLTDAALFAFRRGDAEPEAILASGDHLWICGDCRWRLTALLPREGELATWARGTVLDQEAAVEEDGRNPMPSTAGPSFAPAPTAQAVTPEADERPRSWMPIGLTIAASALIAVVLITYFSPGQEIAKATVPKVQNPTLVRDAAGSFSIAPNGSLETGATLTTLQQQLIGEILRTGRFPASSLPADLVARQSAGPGAADAELAPLAPLGIAVEDRPQFQWNPTAQPAHYRVAVYDKDSRGIAESDSVSGTAWIPHEPLPRGVVLMWQVTVKQNGRIVGAPLVRFQIAAEGDADALLAARIQQPPSHLLLATLYAKVGLKADASRELTVLEGLNPESDLVKKLRASLQ